MFEPSSDGLHKRLSTGLSPDLLGLLSVFPQPAPQDSGTVSTTFPSFCTTLSTGRLGKRCSKVAVLRKPHKRAKRPGAVTPKPLLIRSLAHTIGGTLTEPTNGLTAAAVTHLKLLRTETGRQDSTYVRLAFTYGLTVPEIVEASSLPLERVRRILGGD